MRLIGSFALYQLPLSRLQALSKHHGKAMTISFGSSCTVNGAFGISFEATVDGSSVVCSISPEALQDIDPSNAQCSPEAQFMANRSTFEDIARRKILAGEQRPIRITSADVTA
jgi:hypothetical protein